MPGIENIDKNQNQQIDLQEIQDALKPNWFFDAKNKNFEDNMWKLKTELQNNAFDWQKEYLKTTLHDSLNKAKYDITEKVKQNKSLTWDEIKILKLSLFVDAENYYKVDFVNPDRKKDVNAAMYINRINPLYQNTKAFDGIKKTVDNLTFTENITENIEVLQSTMGAAKEMLVNFCQALQQTMTGASDYRFYHNFISDIQGFLKEHQSDQCSNYTEYQSQMKQFASFFNEKIKSNGKSDTTNPSYQYMGREIAFPSISTDAFISTWNVFTILSKAQTQKDIENAKGKAYTNTREMLGWQLYLLGKKGYLGSFYASENMGKLENDIINAEDMKKYPDLKIISEFLKDLKKESGSQQMLWLDNQYQKLISRLNGKVPTKFILFLQKKFEDQKETLQKEINTVYSNESTDAVQSIAIMNVLWWHRQNIHPQLSKEELVLCAKEYKEKGKFTESIITALEALGLSTQQIKTEIENKAREIRVQQYNQMISARFSSFVLESSLDENPERSDKLGKNNQLFKLYNDIKWVGNEWWASDASTQKRKSRWEQILISIAVTAFSWGVGSLAAWAMLWGIEAATLGWRMLLFAAQMIVEWTVFHAVNTVVTWVISGDIHTMLNELKSPKAWAQSVLYMGVMNGVGMAFRLWTMPWLKTIERAASLSKSVKVVQLMNALNTWMQFSTEILWMMTTDQIVSLTFDQKFKDISVESVMQTVTLVVGLKIAHKIVPMIPEKGDITSDDITITDITKKEWIVTDISYTQKIMNTIDTKIDYLAKQMKIKSGVRVDVVNNILNTIDVGLVKESGKDYSKQLQELKNTIEQLRQEWKLPINLEKKYNEIFRKNQTQDIKKINALQEKPFDELTLKDWEDMWWINEWKAYIRKNELWKSEILSLDKEWKKNIDISKKQNFEDLTLDEFSKLIENIQAKKTKIEEWKTQPERSENKTEEIKDDALVNPEHLLSLPEEEMKIVLEKEVNELKEELKNINSHTTTEQKIAIIKKVEVFFNKIKDILLHIKDHYETVKWMNWVSRIDYMVNLVDELRLHEEVINPSIRKMIMPETHDLITIGLKGIVEAYKSIRVHYENIKQLDILADNKTINETILEDIKSNKHKETQPFEDLQTKYKTLRDVEVIKGKELDFDNRFLITLELHDKWLEYYDKNWELVTGKSINDYLENIGVEPKSGLWKKLSEFAFYQTLDNPPQYNSHGFDHSINVTSYVEMIYKQVPEFVDKVKNSYWLNEKASQFVLKMTGILHDFWYPETENIKAPKSLHGALGAILFEKNIMPEFKIQIKSMEPNITEENLTQLCKDMYNAVFFHSADKVEVTYNGKMIYKDMEFLFEDAESVNSILDALNQSWMFTDQIDKGEITFEINSKNPELVEKIKKEYGEKTKGNKDKVIAQDKAFKGRKVGNDIPWVGIEFQTSSIDSPLSSIIRIADNLDIAYSRLSPLQKDPWFRDIIHSFGPECTWWKLMELMEKYDDVVKDLKKGKENVTQSNVDEALNKIQEFIKDNPKIKIFINGIETEVALTESNIIDWWKPNTYNYKDFIIKKIWVTDVTVKTIWMKQNSISVRHSWWLEPIHKLSDVKIKYIEESWDYVITVNVDKAKFDKLNETTVMEEGLDANGNKIYIEVGIWEYHIRRLYEATRSIDLSGKKCKIQVIGDDGKPIDMWYTYQRSEADVGKVSFDKWETYLEVKNSSEFWTNYDVKEVDNNWNTEYFLSFDQAKDVNISTLGKNIITVGGKKYFRIDAKSDGDKLTEASKK